MSHPENSEKKSLPFELIIPFSTIIRIFFVVLFLTCLKVLAPLLITLFMSTLLAVSLAPIVTWLQTKKVPRWLAVTLLTVVLAALIVGVAAIVLPRIFQELSNFVENLPKLKEQILNSLSAENPLRPLIEHNLNRQVVTPKASDLAPIFNAGNVALDGLTEMFLLFVFTIYLIVDGAGVMHWFSAFFTPDNQAKIKDTADQVSKIIFSYVAGHVITSVFSFFYVLIILSVLHVPSVLLLATLAAILDVLPVLGFFIAVIPALLFAIPISGTTALLVLLLYIVFHSIENYFIIPAIYGSRLQVSGFIILATLMAAWMLAGVEGAIIVLPIVASYPIVERIWLRKYVGTAAIHEHAKADPERNI